jgi:dihydropteroate synthase
MTINCLGNLVNLSSPKVMGILNVTPNSFYDGGKYSSEKELLFQVEKMLTEGETLISVDTFRSHVAKTAIDNGACMVNDISAGSLDTAMMQTVSELQVPYIMMHMKGSPQTMQSLAQYENVTKEILFYFSEKVAQARSLGINDLIVDPGFGFAKTLEQNFEVLNNMELFEMLELPLLVGVSRKSMIYKTLDSSAEFALNGTSVLNTIALQKGANILRVHDVKEAVECIQLVSQL